MSPYFAYIDGNWIDIFSLLVTIAYALIKNYRKHIKENIISKDTAAAIANGTAIFPLFILSLAVISSKLLQELLSANRMILSIAGIAALFSLLEDD